MFKLASNYKLWVLFVEIGSSILSRRDWLSIIAGLFLVFEFLSYARNHNKYDEKGYDSSYNGNCDHPALESLSLWSFRISGGGVVFSVII